MKKIQKKFLKKLYKRGGCVEISWIKDFFYGMDEEMLIKNVINELVEQGKCVVENMPSEEGEERNIVFITTCGLTEIKGADDPVNWKSENLTYERRCHGYSSVLEYYEKEKDKINFYSSVTGFFCRGIPRSRRLCPPRRKPSGCWLSACRARRCCWRVSARLLRS